MIPQSLVRLAMQHGSRARLVPTLARLARDENWNRSLAVLNRLKHSEAKGESASKYSNPDLLGSTSSSDIGSSDDKSAAFDPHHLLSERDIIKEPPRERFGIIKAIVIIVAGIYFGAWLAMVGANVLEELEIFVQDDDDDDDD